MVHRFPFGNFVFYLQRSTQVLRQTLLTHVVHNFLWSIKSTFVFVVFEQVFKNMPEYFGVNGYGMVIGAVFVNGKIKGIQKIKKTTSISLTLFC